jgi:hypothetical protein
MMCVTLSSANDVYKQTEYEDVASTSSVANENVDYIPFFTLQSEFASQTLILSNIFFYKE